jgi:sialate O-acetylesterase
MSFKKILFVCTILFLGSNVYAVLKMPAIISDNMVLQQKMEVPVWGWANAGDKIKVTPSWDSKTAEAAAGANGKWMVKVNTPAAGGPYTIAVSNGSEKIEIKNILIGEVWVCSGQSNMGWKLAGTTNAKEEIANANYPQMRLFTVDQKFSDVPLDDVNGKWELCSSQNAGKFSAVGYYFGKEIHKKVGVPVGMIHNSWGGTPVQCWMKKDVLLSDPDYKFYFDFDKREEAGKDKVKIEYDQQLKQWQDKVKKAKAEGKNAPKQPSTPNALRGQNRCGVLYNAMVHPLMSFGIKGVIWFQGESNAGNAYLYRKSFPAMINNWRKDWGQGDFPFYFVQISSFYENRLEDRPKELPTVNPEEGSTWAELREAQTMTLSVPNTGMAVTMDVGDPYNVHFPQKEEVGKRLALWALAKDYGFKDLAYSGPLYKNMKIENDKIILSFDFIGSGLVAKGGQLKGFTIAGADQKFVWADAKIEGDTVVVSSDKIKEPKAVRYGWANWMECNLFNKENLPASSFRTDNWQRITKQTKEEL